MEHVAFNPCVMECHTRKFLQGGTKHCFSEVMVMLWLAVLIHATFLFWLIDIHPGVCWLETPSFSPKGWVVASGCNFYGQCQIPVLENLEKGLSYRFQLVRITPFPLLMERMRYTQERLEGQNMSKPWVP